jgi:8-oxo-dGTP pyrophosphatase MutT (NUDIX family)
MEGQSIIRQVESAGIVVYRTTQAGEIEYLLLCYTAGHWDFPKGKIEPGENKQEAALRELHEETGLIGIIQPGFTHQFGYNFTDYDGDKAHKIVYFFIGTINKSSVVLSDEHTDYVWLTYDQAYKKLTYKNTQILLRKAQLFKMI